MNDGAAEFARELGRVVDRLRGMPVTKLAASAELAYRASERLLSMAIAAGDRVPALLPRIGDHAAGDQLAVIGHDFASLQPGAAAYAEVTELLVELRRALP
jgi:hypothetical protein